MKLKTLIQQGWSTPRQCFRATILHILFMNNMNPLTETRMRLIANDNFFIITAQTSKELETGIFL